MQAITYTTARKNFAKTMDHVCSDHVPVIVTRSNASSVVMLSLEDYEAMVETVYLLRSPVNAARLKESIDEIESMIAQQEGSQ